MTICKSIAKGKRHFIDPSSKNFRRSDVEMWKNNVEMFHTSISGEFAEIIRQHFAPPGPIVADIVSPEFEQMRDAF